MQIVRNDRTLEQIVFPIPEICEYLTNDTKTKIFHTAERDDQGSKVVDFFDRTEEMFNEMKWQKKLRGQPALFWVSSHMTLWSNILFNCVVLINSIIAFFYPFENKVPGLCVNVSWTAEATHLTRFIVFYCRIEFTFVMADLDDNVDFVGNCVYGTAAIGNSNACRIDHTTNDILRRSRTDAVAAGHIDNHPERRSHRQFDGQSWHVRETFPQNHHRCPIDLPFHLHDVLFGRHNFPSILLFRTGAYRNWYSRTFLSNDFVHTFLLLQLFDVVYREETLLNVIRSVTRNGRSIIFTAVLALILVYLFSIIGYVFFKDDFLVPVDDDIVPSISVNADNCADPADVTLSKLSDDEQSCTAPGGSDVADSGGERKERSCDSLVMCIITTLNQGLRNGGGIGDILRAPSSSVSILNGMGMGVYTRHRLIVFYFFRSTGSIICGSCRLRFALLLHRHHYRFEFDFRCDHRYVCRFA